MDKVKISDFCITGSGGTPSRKEPNYYKGKIAWVKSGDLRENTIFQTEEYISKEGLKNSSAKLVPKGAILLAMYGATVGRMAKLGIDAATNQAVCHILPDPKKAFNDYVYYALLSKVPYFLASAMGGAQPNINQGIVKNTEIPLPDLPTQHHIAQILDQATSLIEKRKAQIAELDKLVKAVFLEMFGDPATNPKKWEMSKLGDLISSQYGTSKKATTEKAEYPILRMNNITYSGEMDYSDIKYIDLDDKEKEKFLVHKGELLFNRTNSKELVGKTGLFELETPMAFAGYLIKITPSERLNAKFLVTYLNSDFIKKMLFNMAKNIIGMANINAKEMGSLPIFVPPLDLQTLFAQKVCKIEAEKDRLQRSLAEMENNLTALMGRFFG